MDIFLDDINTENSYVLKCSSKKEAESALRYANAIIERLGAIRVYDLGLLFANDGNLLYSDEGWYDVSNAQIVRISSKNKKYALVLPNPRKIFNK